MTFSDGGLPRGQMQQTAVPPLPKIWIGYLLGLATFVAQVVAVSLHPELFREQFVVPPLYLFLTDFVSVVYWMVCVHEFHRVLAFVTGGEYPIKPARAAWFHLIPIYQLYWAFKWPREFARFVNTRFSSPVMRPDRIGLLIFLAYTFFMIVNPGVGMLFLFWALSYLCVALRRVIAEPPIAEA